MSAQVLNSGSAVQSVRKLSDGIGLLERQLRHEVVLRHSELLQQLVSLRDTEAVLAVVRAGADSLQASVQVGGNPSQGKQRIRSSSLCLSPSPTDSCDCCVSIQVWGEGNVVKRCLGN